MGFFSNRSSRGYEGDGLIEEIYGSRRDREISEIEKNAERIEAYEAMRAKQRRRGILRGFGVVIILVALTFGVLYLGYSFIFRVSEIEVIGDSPYTSEEISAAAGVNMGDKLFSFSSVDAEKKLTSVLPYIGSLTVDRQIPDKVTLTVKSETPVYYTEIYGKIYLMSDTLRILGEAGDEDLSTLTWLRIPGVKNAVMGSAPVLRNANAEKLMWEIVEYLRESALYGRITQVDLRSIYSLTMVCDNKYLLDFGESSETETKLRIADAVLKDEMFNNSNKARIDLSNLSETIVVVDNQLDFSK